jgi:hypothetical protein
MIEKVSLKKRDEELETIIIERMGFLPSDGERVRNMLLYNMLTVKQVCDLTGLNITTISNKTRPKYNNEGELVTELDFCHAFTDITGSGPKFILRNEKLDLLLRNGRQR